MLFNSLLYLLFSNSVTLRRDLSIQFNRNVILVLQYSIVLHIISLSMSSKGISLHGGLIHISNIIHSFQTFIFFICVLILQLTSFFPRILLLSTVALRGMLLKKLFGGQASYFMLFIYKIINKTGEQFKIIEYPLIILFIIIGAVFLMSTNDLVSIFLSIELQSYGLYILSTIYRNSELSTTGGLIYFLLGGFSSCFILLASSLLYANSGTTNLDGIYIISNINDSDSWYQPYYINFCLLIFSIGFLFKVSAAPFHFWSPDVYDAIPTIVTAFVAIIAKISILILILDFISYTSNIVAGLNNNSGGYEAASAMVGSIGDYKDQIMHEGNSKQVFGWIIALLLSSLFSLIIGTVLGLTQFRIKRLLAYSTISHIGFILLALSVNTIESIQSFIFYLMQYSISNLNIFLILLGIGYAFYCYVSENKEHEELLEKNNSPVQLVNQLRGYFHINPIMSLALGITIFSFIGVPPLIGFFAKQMVLSAALDNGYIFISLIAVLTSVIGGVYYLNIVKEVFFFSPEHKINPYWELKNNHKEETSLESNLNVESNEFSRLFNYKNITINSPISVIISIITLIVLLFVFSSYEWLSMGTILVHNLYQT